VRITFLCFFVTVSFLLSFLVTPSFLPTFSFLLFLFQVDIVLGEIVLIVIVEVLRFCLLFLMIGNDVILLLLLGVFINIIIVAVD